MVYITINMSNQTLSIEMHIALHSATNKVYSEFIKRCIAGIWSEEKGLLLSNILNEVPVTDQAFNWLAENVASPDSHMATLLIDKKMELDVFIENVVTRCKKEGHEDISLNLFDNILNKIYPAAKMAYKIHLYELLMNDKYSPYMCYMHCNEKFTFPIQNITDNYKSVYYCIDQALTKAAYYARWKTFQDLWAIQNMRRLHWRFQPSTNAQHTGVLNWIQSNVRRGEEDVDATLGWSCGPDSAYWPSTHLRDYKNILDILHEIMK